MYKILIIFVLHLFIELIVLLYLFIVIYLFIYCSVYRRTLFKCVVKCLRFGEKKEIASLIFAFARGLKPRPSHLGVKMSDQSAVTTPCLNLESVVRGHHVYKRVGGQLLESS